MEGLSRVAVAKPPPRGPRFSPLRRALLALLTLAAAHLAPAADLLRVAVPAEPIDWHPGRSRSAVDALLHDEIYERLVALGPGGEPIPALALAWERTEPTVWRFALRPGVRFSNGEPFDARVAAANLLVQRDDLRASARTWLRPIADVIAIDPLTVEIRTLTPQTEIPIALAWAGRMAPLAYGFEGGVYADRLLTAPVGTGPYRLASHERGDHLRLEPNPGWWGAPVPALPVEVRVIPDPAARADALAAGDVEHAVALAPDDLPRLRAAGVTVRPVMGQRLAYLALDSFRALGGAPPEGSPGLAAGAPNPLRDARVRRAISLAIDRPHLAEVVLLGAAHPTATPTFPDGAATPPDPLAARALLAEAGFPNGFALEILAVAPQLQAIDATLAALERDLAAIGIALTPVALPPTEAVRRVGQLEVSAALIAWGGLSAPERAWSAMFGSDPDAGTFGSQNVGRYQGADVLAALQRLRGTVDAGERADAGRDLLRAFASETPIVPLYVTADARAYAPGWDAVTFTLEALDLRGITPSAPATSSPGS